jgi:hypothetical protein
MQSFQIYIVEYDGDARPPRRRRTTRASARRARRRIQRALRAEQALEEALQLAVMEQQAAEYERFQRLQEEQERRREEEKKEEANNCAEKILDKVEEERFWDLKLNWTPREKECTICMEKFAIEQIDGASMCSKSEHWICYTCLKNILVEAYIKAPTNTFAACCPYCREKRIFNKNMFN